MITVSREKNKARDKEWLLRRLKDDIIPQAVIDRDLRLIGLLPTATTKILLVDELIKMWTQFTVLVGFTLLIYRIFQLHVMHTLVFTFGCVIIMS